tara:strand:- start:537 stop:713 length:177 start_codon:yes stop_codon:yes gene_type:complete
LKRGGRGPHDSCDKEDIEELKDRIYQELLNVNLYTEVELLYKKKHKFFFLLRGDYKFY